MAKTAGAIFLTDSTVTPLDEETSIAKTGDKKMKFAFQIESKYANRVYLLVAPDDKTRKVQTTKSLSLSLFFFLFFH
jgi:hypothetical protein